MRFNKTTGNKVRCIAASAIGRAALVATAFCATSAALATDLESFYFRYDFSGGTKQFTGSASQASDPCADSISGTGSYGPDGADNTAFCISGEPYGSNTIGGSSDAGKAVLAADWTLAMSLRPGSVNKGILFSLGRANANGNKVIFLASSSSSGKLYVGTARRKLKSGTYSDSNTRELAHEWELTTSADLTTGFHTIVAVHTSGGSVKIYIDGELVYIGGDPTATTIDTTLDCNAADCSFGNGIQFNQAHGTAQFLNAVGYSQSSGNPDVAFQDVRFYNSAFTAEDAAAYAALYPATAFRVNAYVRSYGKNSVDTGYYVNPTTRISVDFQYVETTQQNRIFGERGALGCALYINQNNKFACLINDGYNTGSSSLGLDANTSRAFVTIDRVTGEVFIRQDGNTVVKTLPAKWPATSTADITLPLFAEYAASATQNWSKAYIYSVGIQESGTPVHFFAPATNATGAVGFYDVIGGTFHGEAMPSPETPLFYGTGVGCADDYKYESGTLYAKLYATSGGNGTVSVADGAAAASAEGWIPHGGTLALEAVPAANMEFKEWIGDTWAIADGSSTTDAAIEVSTPSAVQLRATFKPAVDALLTVAADGGDSINWSEADWRDIENSEAQIPYPTDKNVTIVAHKSFTLTLDVAVALSNLTVRADTNCVVTLTKGVGSLVTVETIIESGVLKQGSDTALGNTPKITVQDGGTFDINGKTIRQETPIYIAGAGAGDWPWALATSSTMASGNYLYDLYLNANATAGKGQFKLGRNNANSFIYLYGYTLTAKSWMTRMNINTMDGTLDLQAGATFNAYNNLNKQTAYRGTTMIVHEGYTYNNQTDREVYISYLKMFGGEIGYGSTARDFGVWNELHGYGTIKKLVMGDGAKYYPDGEHYLNVTEALSGTVTVDLSGFDFTSRTEPVPLLKVPTSLADTARSSLDLTVPTGWKLKEKTDGGNVTFTLGKPKGVMVIAY